MDFKHREKIIIMRIQPLRVNINNNITFSAWRKKSKVIEPLQNTKPYSILAEIERKNQEDKEIRQRAAKALIHEEYREKNTLKEKALIYLPILGAYSAIRIFGKFKK